MSLNVIKENLNKVISKIKYRLGLYFADGPTKRFVNYSRNIWCDWKVTDSNAVILVDLFGIPFLEIARSYFLNILAVKQIGRAHV